MVDLTEKWANRKVWLVHCDENEEMTKWCSKEYIPPSTPLHQMCWGMKTACVQFWNAYACTLWNSLSPFSQTWIFSSILWETDGRKSTFGCAEWPQLSVLMHHGINHADSSTMSSNQLDDYKYDHKLCQCMGSISRHISFQTAPLWQLGAENDHSVWSD